MKALRIIVTLLLCLIVPIQGFAALGIAKMDCPAMSMGHDMKHGLGPGDDSMPCCTKDGGKESVPQKLCDPCGSCPLCSVVVSIASLEVHWRYQCISAERLHEPLVTSLNLFAIWRPPSLG